MKFRRCDIERALAKKGEEIDTTFVIEGHFDDGTAPDGQLYDFTGQDSITKIIVKKHKCKHCEHHPFEKKHPEWVQDKKCGETNKKDNKDGNDDKEPTGSSERGKKK